MIVLVDYGLGNIGSIVNMIRKVGAEPVVASGPDSLLKAGMLILPGVGAFDSGMRNLREMGYLEVLHKRVLVDRIPILGICLGMQMFSRKSEEGVELGLGWLDAETIRFRLDADAIRVKIPHMGWNNVHVSRPSVLFPNREGNRRFYFIHSFHVRCKNPEDIIATTQYGIEFASAVCHENILGVQFHPEKSHRFGFELFRNFLNWKPGGVDRS